MFRFFIPIIILMFGAILYTGYIQDAHDRIAELRQEIQVIESTFTTRDEIEDKIEELAAADALISDGDEEKLARLVPRRDEFDLPMFLYDIYNVAVVKGGKELEGLNASINPEVVDGYGTANVSFSIRATYDEFQDFIVMLEKNEQLFDIKSVTFSGPKSAFDESTYTVSLTAYWMP